MRPLRIEISGWFFNLDILCEKDMNYNIQKVKIQYGKNDGIYQIRYDKNDGIYLKKSKNNF